MPREISDNKVVGLCAIILNSKNKILLGKRARVPYKGKWGLFSGIGASLEGLEGSDAINKEVKMDLSVDAFDGKKLFSIDVENDPKIYRLDVYLGKVQGKIIPHPQAASEVKWYSLADCLKKGLAFDHDNILTRYKEILDNE
jgi:ADP-ribose pyrophosphatase YjhB (NUDIX family)